MPLLVNCPNGCQIRVPVNRAGRVVRCPTCKSAIRIAGFEKPFKDVGQVIEVPAKLAKRKSEPSEEQPHATQANATQGNTTQPDDPREPGDANDSNPAPQPQPPVEALTSCISAEQLTESATPLPATPKTPAHSVAEARTDTTPAISSEDADPAIAATEGDPESIVMGNDIDLLDPEIQRVVNSPPRVPPVMHTRPWRRVQPLTNVKPQADAAALDLKLSSPKPAIETSSNPRTDATDPASAPVTPAQPNTASTGAPVANPPDSIADPLERSNDHTDEIDRPVNHSVVADEAPGKDGLPLEQANQRQTKRKRKRKRKSKLKLEPPSPVGPLSVPPNTSTSPALPETEDLAETEFPEAGTVDQATESTAPTSVASTAAGPWQTLQDSHASTSTEPDMGSSADELPVATIDSSIDVTGSAQRQASIVQPPVIDLDASEAATESQVDKKSWEERLRDANADRHLLTRFLAGCLLILAIVNMVPALYHWRSWSLMTDPMPLPRWIYLQIFVGAIYAVYATFLLQINDWSALRSVSVAMLVLAFLFGVVSTGLLVGGRFAGILGIPFSLNRHAGVWCVAMLILATIMSYWAGKESSNWRRAEKLLLEILQQGQAAT